MSDNSIHTDRTHQRHRSRFGRSGVLACLLAAMALSVASCSSGSSSPGVAGAGSKATTARSSSASSSSGPLAKMLSYSKCMRSHGIADFPDPTADPGGGAGLSISANAGSDLSRTNPQFKAADAACKSLLPGGSRTPAQLANDVAAGVKLAECMRSHGVPSWPDPDSQNVVNLPNGIDTNSPQVASALQTCRSLTKAKGLNIRQAGSS